ncbi:ParB N-terminal domain-containing protein [uncultured Desulfosarcina sp.]|uniref:ParB N-terminal domain-containing protein n=1 Tax=uncultured Desulfosarcina sp. TaxID=218289 RepID=UPI0029C7543F|nr:ParB N-terminal domain-containing protein [uncultured Desulfosarcina sp.]
MMTKGWRQDSITLRGEEIELKVGYCNQSDLFYFPENPRIFSIVAAGDKTPTQEEIEKALQKREHVRQLAQSIKANGGLTDPIFVREDSKIVLEGNSRLAAYRLLAEKDPAEWGQIKCKLLPKGINEDIIFSLLGEYHIVGKKDWAPFEQAGYLYRRNHKFGASAADMARGLGRTTNDVNKLINTYSFMVQHNDTDPNNWSYYFEYLKSRKIQKCREDYPKLDDVIVSKIKSGEIAKAAQIRDELPKIIKAGKKVVSKLVNETKDFQECIDIAIAKGADDQTFQHIKRFRNWIVTDDVSEEILKLPKDIQQKIFYELKKIRESIDLLEKHRN